MFSFRRFAPTPGAARRPPPQQPPTPALAGDPGLRQQGTESFRHPFTRSLRTLVAARVRLKGLTWKIPPSPTPRTAKAALLPPQIAQRRRNSGSPGLGDPGFGLVQFPSEETSVS